MNFGGFYMKNIKKIVALLLVLATVFCITACDIASLLEGLDKEQGEDEGNENININLIKGSTFSEARDKYRVVDSYILDDGNYYYFYNLGTIDYVPLNTYNAEGVYFNGSAVTLEFKMTTINKGESIREIKSAIDSSVSLSTETYAKGEISADIFSAFEAKVESGIINKNTNTVSSTCSDSFSMSISNETLYEQTITYKMDRDDPVGFYFYTPVASVRVYEVVVYNPNTGKVEHMSTYNQFGAAIPGLYYSPNSFVDFGDYDIEFDENLIPSFDTPTQTATSDITVPINANGASCEVSSWSGKIGEKYGTLPNVSMLGYNFLGWYADGIRITEDSVAIAAKSIDAYWELKTKVTYRTSGSISVNAGHKLNPFGLIIVGTTGEESASFDKILNEFDLATLKDEGYRMRIILEYDVKRSKLAAFGLEYDINLTSGSNSIAKFHESINNSSFVSKRNYSDYIDLSRVTGSLNMELSTKNVFDVTVQNLRVTVEFVK